MRIGSLFSGYAGLDAGVRQVLGGTAAWHSDIEPASIRLLEHHYPDVPNLGDITTVDWSAVEPVDVLTGGFPCQDLSMAGKRLGLRPGTRSGLWEHMAYAVFQLRPPLVVIENVRGLLSARAHSDVEPCPWCVGDGSAEPLRALGAVLGDLAGLGYDATWVGLRAADVGAPHGRFRVFIAATDSRRNGRSGGLAWGPSAQLTGAARRGLSASADSHRTTGGERRVAAPGQTEGGRSRTHTGRRGGEPATDPTGDGWDEGRPESAGLVGGSDAPLSGDGSAADAGGERHGRGQDTGMVGQLDRSDAGEARQRERSREVSGRGDTTDWGQYEPAIRRWERVLGRVAPPPTEPGRTGQPRLSPRFVEWLMGLPDGHVTAVPGLSRNEQLKLLGNGVVPAQAAAALRHLLAAELVAA